MTKVYSEWLQMTEHKPPLETPILVKHRYGVEAVQFQSAAWRYWYTGQPVDEQVLKSATHFMIAKFPE